MGATGMGLLLEEHRTEIIAAWRQAVERELGVKEPALAFAVAPMLREMALSVDDPRRSHEAWTRCAVLVRSNAAPAQLAREMKLLHRCLWEALRGRGAPVSPAERRTADEWLDEALAESLDRLERVRIRAASFEGRAPVIVPPIARKVTPPPLPTSAARRTPPPLRRAEPEILELEPIGAARA